MLVGRNNLAHVDCLQVIIKTGKQTSISSKAQSFVDGLGASFQSRRVFVPTPIYGAMILSIPIIWSLIEQDASFGL